MDLFKNLNENQIKAVKAINGPVIVVAGAGSGKTRVLTHRLAYLVESGVDSSNILAVTFTNKAAKEMRDRVDNMLKENNRSTIMTFHSLCARILRCEANHIGYRPNFEIYDDDESQKVIKKIFDDLQFNNTAYKIKEVKNYISAIKNGKKYDLEPRKQKDFDLCYEKYNERLKFENALDFDDLLLKTVELFNNKPEVLDYYQRKFLYIMIDEFQDTNTIQYELVELLGDRFKNVFVVGDGDQSIYSFRNANVGNIKEFIKHFKPIQIVLDINYRSKSNILEAANSLISHNSDRIKKDLKSVQDPGDLVELKRCDTAQSEMLYIKNKILALIIMDTIIMKWQYSIE
jgi:DNA helicase-2/ATP-dependent DNA helicase PcrA